MGMEDAAATGEEKILTDLPIMGIRVKSGRSANDFDSDGKALLIHLGGELVEMEKVFLAEDDHTPISPDRVEVRKTDSLPVEDPSFWNHLRWKLRCFRKDILWTEKARL
jgi:hypothetical protein